MKNKMNNLTPHNEDLYRERLKLLDHYAQEDGYEISPESEKDFWRFIRMAHFKYNGDVVLDDDGNLRAIWRDDQENHFALRFYGEDRIVCVFFDNQDKNKKTIRTCRTESFETIMENLPDFIPRREIDSAPSQSLND